MRKVVGALIALAAMVAAAASQPGIEQVRREAASDDARQAADAVRGQLGAAMDGFLHLLAERAANAAALPQVRAQLALLRNESIEGPLGTTLRDFFRTERDWEPWRREFPLHGVSTEGTRVGLLFGAPSRTFDPSRLIERARAGSATADFVIAADIPHAVAAAPIALANGGSAVLLLGRPLEEPALAEIGRRAGLPILLSDGSKVIARQGDNGEMARLAQAVGHERQGDGLFAAPDVTWAAAARPVVPGFWLWALVDNAEGARAAAASARTTQTIVWSAGALIALLALFIGFRRPAPAADPNSTIIAPEDTRAPVVVEPSTPTPLAPARVITPARSPAQGGDTVPIAGTPLRPFGRYILLDQLGEGGMARVYRAVVFGAEGFRRKFVVKRLRPELVEDQSVVAQFIDEANMASHLVHSNIVPVLDFGKVDDEYYLATEYILGRDLNRITLRCLELDHRAMPIDAVLFVAQEVLKALEYAHGKTSESGRPLGIVHRDVSPSNVLVSARGEVKLFDFGIVKAEGRVTRTQHGVVKGNVSFMSPEQARGMEVDRRADLFSLGLVLYTCASGRALYEGNSSYELLLKAATGPGPDELARVRELPSPLGGIVAKALTVDPAGRFQTATEFAAAVAPHVSRGPVELTELVTRLFADDFRKEEASFAGAAPPGPTAASMRAAPEGRS